MVGQVVALGEVGEAAVALEEPEGGDGLEDRGPHGVVVDRRGHHGDVRLAGAELGEGDLLDVQRLAGVLVPAGQALEHVDLVLVDGHRAVGLRQLEVGEVVGGRVSGLDGFEDGVHVCLLVRHRCRDRVRRYRSVTSGGEGCDVVTTTRWGRPSRRRRRWARRPSRTPSARPCCPRPGKASTTRTWAPRQRGTAVTGRGPVEHPADRGGDVLDGQQDAGEGQRRLRVVELVVEHRGPDAVGADAADVDAPDAGQAQVGRGAEAEAEHRVLGPGVDALARHGDQAGQRGDVDDVAAALPAHPADGAHGAVHDADRVDLDHQATLLRRLLPRRAGDDHPGVVDPDVQRPGALDGQRGRGVARRGVADVEARRRRRRHRSGPRRPSRRRGPRR